MKKILFIILTLVLIGIGLFFLFGGKNKINDLFNNEADFGTFFDINTPSQNNFIDADPTTNQPQVINPDQQYKAPILRQISFEPVSGYTSYATTSTSTIVELDENNLEVTKIATTTSTAIRFQERATGHIYDVFEFMFAPQQISNITIPRIYETIFTNNINEFIYKTLDRNNEQIISKKGIISRTTSEDPEDTSFVSEIIVNSMDLSNVVRNMTYNKETSQLVYSVFQNNQSSLFTANADRTNEKLVKTIFFNEFLIKNINPNEVLITTKASRDTLGYAYTLNTSTGAFSKILGDIKGLLTITNPSKSFVLYSESNQTQPITRVLNRDTNIVSQVIINTLPSEKCVFARTNDKVAYCFGSLIYTKATYPDDWYKGKVTNIEDLYQVNLETGSTFPVFYFNNERNSADFQEFDAMNVSITPNDSHLIFQNKKDLTLWTIDLLQMNGQLF